MSSDILKSLPAPSLTCSYIFDHVFRMDASQEDVFEKTAKPLLPGVLDGFNATVFAYGVSSF